MNSSNWLFYLSQFDHFKGFYSELTVFTTSTSIAFKKIFWTLSPFCSFLLLFHSLLHSLLQLNGICNLRSKFTQSEVNRKLDKRINTSFHFSRNNVSELEKCVSEILEKTDNYLKQNKLTMNTGKTELLCVSKKHENFDPIIFRGQEIKPQSHCRYLGIIIDSKLNFHVQLNNVLSNMATAIRSIYLLRYQLPLEARLMLFKSLVLSHLTFSALFLQKLNFSAMQRINRQINWGIKVCYLRKKFERSRDLLVKSDILPAELLISQMSVSKHRNDISLLKTHGTESFF